MARRLDGMTTNLNTALVVGSNGLFGNHLCKVLRSNPGWQVIRCSRSSSGAGEPEICVDLTDPGAAAELAASLPPVTHVFYAARLASSDPDAETAINTTMFRNVLEAIAENGSAVRHVQVMHGTKWYGGASEPYPTPAREDGPRAATVNFYHTQQDMLADRSARASWTWSALRPHTICAADIGYSHSFVPLLGAHAALCGKMGIPLIFPGSEACFHSVRQATDIGLLADAAIWAATTPSCGGEAFNVVNADFFRWCDVWPRIARFFELDPGPVQPIRLGSYANALAPAWEKLARVGKLTVRRIEQIGDWSYFDRILRSERDDMSSTEKLRRYGFDRIVGCEAMFLRLFAQLREQRVIP